MAKIEITVDQLELLLNEQKRITVNKCLEHNYVYNKESTEGNLISLPIDEEKFKKQGMGAKFPNDFEILKKYLK